jgi:glutamyl-tRNA(Gln) amidotransferase subunit D
LTETGALSRERSGYSGPSLELLEKFGVKVGESVALETDDELHLSGILLPRYEHADNQHVVLKLKSGYNVGLKVDRIRSISPLQRSESGLATHDDERTLERKSRVTASKGKVLLLSTGGTIASRVDYRTGAVHPALSAADLYSAVPELDQLAVVEPEVVFSIYSENMTPAHWEELSNRIARSTKEKEDYNGIVVMMGTDTMSYAAAALTFSLIGLKVPVVFVGAQRSSDRPSSDAALNLKAAVWFAASTNRKGVFVAMHENENDDSIAVHSAVRVRKNHTSRRDAFESIDASLIARIRGKEINYPGNQSVSIEVDGALSLRTKFETRVALIKYYPGFYADFLQLLADSEKVKGIIIEGTGLGHVSAATVKKIGELVSKGVFIGITSQCIWGHVDLNVYDTGRDMISAGAIPLQNMLAEVAYVKLSWALGNFEDVKNIMLKNFAGEYSNRLELT